jgi:hypothetical protein
LLHAKKADNSEVKQEFRYLSITLLGLIKKKMNSLAADKTATFATKNRNFSSFGNKSRKYSQKLIVMR